MKNNLYFEGVDYIPDAHNIKIISSLTFHPKFILQKKLPHGFFREYNGLLKCVMASDVKGMSTVIVSWLVCINICSEHMYSHGHGLIPVRFTL